MSDQTPSGSGISQQDDPPKQAAGKLVAPDVVAVDLSRKDQTLVMYALDRLRSNLKGELEALPQPTDLESWPQPADVDDLKNRIKPRWPRSSIFILTIIPGGEFGRMQWQIAFNRPPTTDEATEYINGQRSPSYQNQLNKWADACIETIQKSGVPESYTAGSQWLQLYDSSQVTLTLVKSITLAFEKPAGVI